LIAAGQDGFTGAAISTPRSLIEVTAAGKFFPNGTRALQGVQLSVKQGEFLTLLGPSGCGKSTLLKLMAGLVSPTEGQVNAFEGRIGFVFQDATLMPWASALANVRLPLDLEGVARQPADARAEKALAAVGLSGAGGHRPRELSGGMRMRVSIARALVNEPQVLLMDEPFSALDEITRNRLDADLVALWRERGLTVVFVTHSVFEAVFLSTRVVVLSNRPGRVFDEFLMPPGQARDEAFRYSPEFAANCRAVQQMLAQAGTV
jgi:NitT/TauT family transport system ATP-binding protein